VPAPCAARQPGPKGTPRHHAGTMFTAENPAGRKGEEGKPPSGLCNRGREEKEWPVPQAPAFLSVRLLPRGADRGHHHQQKGGAPSSVSRLRKASALNAQLFTPRSFNSPGNGSVSFSVMHYRAGSPCPPRLLSVHRPARGRHAIPKRRIHLALIGQCQAVANHHTRRDTQ